MSFSNFQTVFGDLIGVDVGVAGLLIFAAITVLIVAVSKSIQATMVILIPVTMACMAIGIIGTSMAMIMLIVIVAIIALSAAKIPGGR